MVIALWIVLPLVCVLAIGFAYQSLGCRRDRLRHAEGRWVNIGGRQKIYLFERGQDNSERGQGDPVVIFESGIGATHLNWRRIQDAVAEFASTVSYDRAGLGWSSPCRTPRTPGNIAPELRKALRLAGIEPPYVLVGHSFGGLVMRRFALLYPDDVAAVILVDPMRCEDWPPLDPSKQSQIDLGQKLIRFAVPVTRCGLARLLVSLLFCRAAKLSDCIVGATGSHPRHVLDRVKTEVGKMPRIVWPAVAAHWSSPRFYSGIRHHIRSIPETVKEMHAAEFIRETPVTVLTPRNASPLSQEQLDRIGNRIQQVIAQESEHWIHLDEPQLVIDTIRENLVTSVPSVATAGD